MAASAARAQIVGLALLTLKTPLTLYKSLKTPLTLHQDLKMMSKCCRLVGHALHAAHLRLVALVHCPHAVAAVLHVRLQVHGDVVEVHEDRAHLEQHGARVRGQNNLNYTTKTPDTL